LPITLNRNKIVAIKANNEFTGLLTKELLMMKYTSLLVLLLAVVFITETTAQETQWRGPNRDGIYSETGLLKSWPENGPEKLLVIDSIGNGYSSAVFYEGLIYVSGRKDSFDICSAIDMSGKIVWQETYGGAWPNSFPETRSTPTIENGKVYLVSGVGELVCLNAKTGSIIWIEEVDNSFEAEWSRFGVSESPLIIDDLIYCTPAGETTTIVAYNKIDGKLVWKSESVGGKRIYASPGTYTYNGKLYIIAQTNLHVFAADPKTGEIIWKFLYQHQEKDPKEQSTPFTNTPSVKGNEIFITCGYNVHAAMLQLNEDGTQVTEKWTDTIFDNHHHGVVVLGDYIYGSNWQNNRKGNWVCMKWDTGELMWEEQWGTKGEIIFADGLCYLYEEKSGNIGLINPNPEKFELISWFEVTDGTGPYWNHPTIFDGKLFLRHGEALMVYDIKMN
jgi:outer membrane protein assembly factor BamB